MDKIDRGNVVAELRSLGIEPKYELDLIEEKELQELAEFLKQSLLEDYHLAYGERGFGYEDEAKSTVNP